MLKPDVRAALNDSKSHIVSKEFQSAKNYYEQTLNEIYLNAACIIDASDESNLSKIKES
jgi:hypothetical protein